MVHLIMWSDYLKTGQKVSEKKNVWISGVFLEGNCNVRIVHKNCVLVIHPWNQLYYQSSLHPYLAQAPSRPYFEKNNKY